MNQNSILYLTVLAIVFFITFSCSKQSTSELKIINVLESAEREISISEIADDIAYIPLSDDSLLSYIMKVVYSDGEYFVEDNKSTFLRFDEDGNFVNKIGNKGNGPGEYNYVSDFVIHPDTREIFIIGGKKDHIMVYSPNGQFIRSFELAKQNPMAIGISNMNVLVYYFSGAEHDTINIQLMDVNGTVLNNCPNKYEFERGRAILMHYGECLMYKFAQKLHFKEIFSDTIFYLDGQEIIPETILNSGDKRYTPEIRSKIINELSSNPGGSSESMRSVLTQNNLFETQNFLFYTYHHDGEGRFLVYNKLTGEQNEINSEQGIVNDLDGGPNIQLKKNINDNILISWIDAFELKMHVESAEFNNSTPIYPEKKKELERLANSLNENDNPVLMLVKLKD